jgi:formyltetrahydrofolate synthetase
MLLQHYGLPVIVALNSFGSDTERAFEMIRKHLGEQAKWQDFSLDMLLMLAARAGLKPELKLAA